MTITYFIPYNTLIKEFRRNEGVKLVEFSIDQRGDSKIAIIISDELVIQKTQDALDLMVDVQYQGCAKLILNKENIIENFFDLRTGIAGEILQKFVNYQVKLAIVGDFHAQSKSLGDFIYECNQGKQIFFTSTITEAVKKLHCIN